MKLLGGKIFTGQQSTGLERTGKTLCFYVIPPGRVAAARTLALACQTIGRVEFRIEIALPPGIDGDSQEFGFFPGNSRFSHAW